MRSRTPLKLLYTAMTKAPDMSIPLIKGLLRKHVTSDIDYAIGKGKALKAPLQISLRITNKCNHRCAICGQYGAHGYMNMEKGKALLNDLPLDRYKKLVDEVAKYKPVFYLTGGEPYLYPGFVELMNYIKKKGCLATVVTNGVLLDKYAEEAVKNKWDFILVSLDGPEDIHDACRNVKGAYKTAIKGLIKVRETKKKLGSARPFLMTSTTISNVNASHLERTFEIGKEIMPDLMVVYLSWFTSEALGKKHSRILKDNLGVEAYTWKSYATKFTKKQADTIKRSVTKVRGKKWPFEYFFIPDIKNEELEKYYLHPEKMFGYSKCVAPFMMVDVMPNGDVVTCRDFIDVKVGNIMEKPLLEIWNNKGFMDFRKLLIKQKGLLPQCSRCCGLMGF